MARSSSRAGMGWQRLPACVADSERRSSMGVPAEQAVRLDEVMDLAERLPVHEQETLVEIMRSRLRDRRREALLADVAEAQEAYRRGDCTRGTVEALMAEIDQED